MSKQYLGSFMVVLTLLSLLSAFPVIPVWAHTTVGDPIPSGRADATHRTLAQDGSGQVFASNTGFSRHVPGPTGYVFPGSGQIGLQSRAFPAFRDPNEELQGPRTSNLFSPSASILTSTATFANKGDLILAVNVTVANLNSAEVLALANIVCSNTAAGTTFTDLAGGTITPSPAATDISLVTERPTFHREGLQSLRYRSLTVYVPPEFTPPVNWATGDVSNIMSTLTDDLDQIHVFKAPQFDPYAPGWWAVQIATREDVMVFPMKFIDANAVVPVGFTSVGVVQPNVGTCTQKTTAGVAGQSVRLLMEDRFYYLRLNEMAAPQIAGEYFFNFFLNATYVPSVTGKTWCDIGLGNMGVGGSTFKGRICPEQTNGGSRPKINNVFPGPDGVGPTGPLVTSLSARLKSVPAQNWPSLLVKAEIDPAVILGTLRHGGIANSTLFGQGVKLPCKVVAEGTANDPLTGKPTGRRVVAWGFTNATRQGKYEVQGLAAGTYTVTGSCAGFPRLTLERQITLSRGQSLHGVDFFLRAGAVIAAKVNCKLIEDPNVVQNCQGFPLLRDADSVSDRDGSAATVAAPDLTKYTVTFSPPSATATGNLWFSGAGSPGFPRCRDGNTGSALIPAAATTAGEDSCVAVGGGAPVDVNGASAATTGRKPFDPSQHRNENTQLAFFDAMNIAGFSFDPNSPSSSVTGNIATRNDYFAVTSLFASKGFNTNPTTGTIATPARGGTCLGAAILNPVISVSSGATTLTGASATRPFGNCAGDNAINWNPTDFSSLEGWRPYTVEIYDASGNLVSFSPHNNTDLPFTSYTWDNQTIIYQRAAFPWESVVGPGFSPVGVHNGVGPALSQSFPDVGIWWANNKQNFFRFQFGNKPGFAFSDGFGVYGAPSGMDAHVPQTFATWTDGLSPGTYTIRVWMNGYVQLQNFTFVIPSFEEAGIVQREIDLFRSSVVNLLVHFSDTQEGTLITNPIGGPDPGRYVIVQAFDANRKLVGWNYTWTQANTTDLTVEINGLGMAGPETLWLIMRDPTAKGGTSRGVGGDFTSPFGGILASEGAFFPVGDDHLKRGFYYFPNADASVGRRSMVPWMRFFQYYFTGDQDYGLLPATYTFRVYTRGYVQTVFPATTIGFGGLPANLSFTLLRGAGINYTINSKDSETPPQRVPWRFGDFYFQDLQDAIGDLVKVQGGFFPLCRNFIQERLDATRCAESSEEVRQGDVNVGKTYSNGAVSTTIIAHTDTAAAVTSTALTSVAGTRLPTFSSGPYNIPELIRPDGTRLRYPEIRANTATGGWSVGQQASQVTARPGIDPETGNIVRAAGAGFPFIDCATKLVEPIPGTNLILQAGTATCLNNAPISIANSPYNFPNFPNRHFLVSNLLGPLAAAATCISGFAVAGICAPATGGGTSGGFGGTTEFARTRDPQDFGQGFTAFFIRGSVDVFNGSWFWDRYGPANGIFWARASPVNWLGTQQEVPLGDESIGVSSLIWGFDQHGTGIGDSRAGTVLATLGLDTGLYQVFSETYGYVQRDDQRLVVSLTRSSSISDIKQDDLAGAVIQAVVDFKTEGIFTAVPFNMFFRYRIEDTKGNLMAYEHSGRHEAGKYNIEGFRFGAIPDPGFADKTAGSPATTGVTRWKFFTAGFQPFTLGNFPTRSFNPGNKLGGIDDGTYNINLQVFFATRAAPTANAISSPILSGLPISTNPSLSPGATEPNGFPPGLMQGFPWYGGFRPGFGPYAARGTITVSVTRFPGTGVAVATFELDRLGTIRGLVLGFNLQGDLRTISWAQVSATGSPAVTQPTFDGQYEMFVQPGTYSLRAVEYTGNIGHTSQTKGVTITGGADISGIDFQLVESGVPIPEFPIASLLILALAMAASLIVLRRVRRTRSA